MTHRIPGDAFDIIYDAQGCVTSYKLPWTPERLAKERAERIEDLAFVKRMMAAPPGAFRNGHYEEDA